MQLCFAVPQRVRQCHTLQIRSNFKKTIARQMTGSTRPQEAGFEVKLELEVENESSFYAHTG